MAENQKPTILEPIFTSDHDWHCNACINWSHDALELYTMGYKEAADNLVEQIVEGGILQDVSCLSYLLSISPIHRVAVKGINKIR